jgi:tetratricopeptide (TPR) repeat protein
MGDADAANVRATLHHLVALDTLQGSDGLSPLAVRSFRSAADRLAVVGGDADVRTAVADLGAAAAWITSDAVEREQSRMLALEALALADMAGDVRLHRFLLSHLSMVSEHGGRYADALAYADRLLAEDHDNPRVEAMVQVRRARALSGLTAHTDAVEAWERASGLLTLSPTADDGLTYWINDAEMAIHKAVILSRAGDRTAVEWAHRGVEELPAGQGRDQVLFRAMLLDDAVTAHAWSEVPAIAEDLMRYAGRAGSARVPELLGRVWRKVQRLRVPAVARDAIRASYETFR